MVPRASVIFLWWVAVVVVLVATLVLDWSRATCLVVSAVAAAVQGRGHLVVVRDRAARRPSVPRDGGAE